LGSIDSKQDRKRPSSLLKTQIVPIETAGFEPRGLLNPIRVPIPRKPCLGRQASRGVFPPGRGLLRRAGAARQDARADGATVPRRSSSGADDRTGALDPARAPEREAGRGCFPAPRIVNSPPLLEVAGGDHQPCDQRDEHQYVEPERSLVPPERRFGLRRVTSRLDVGAQGEFIGEVRALADGGELWVSADREGCHLFLSAVASSLACRHSEAEE